MQTKSMFPLAMLATLALLVVPACSEGKKDGAICKSIAAKMVDCGVLTSGEYACGFEPTNFDRCWRDCVTGASCASVETLFCDEDLSGDLLDCAQSCITEFGFACDDGNHIPPHWECDGWLDCDDGSDESDCPGVDNFLCLDGTEVFPSTYVCDGEEDCFDGSDEMDCPGPFTCTDGETIPASWECNGWLDCLDGSDEDSCQGNTVFECADGFESVPQAGVCDEFIDCEDASDELDCPGNIVFPCADGVSFVYTSWVCDLEADCPDGSDETGCAQLQCASD